MSTCDERDFPKFIGTAVHALRSPLSRIYCAGQELRENYLDVLDETGNFFVQSVCEASEEVEDLLAALSDLSRIYGITPHIGDVDVAALASEEKDEACREYGLSDVVFNSPAPAVVQADECLLRKAVRELIRNAVRFSMGAGQPSITLFVVDEGEGWQIRVSDNGVGFDQHLADRLFYPFQRLHRKSGLSGKGTGLAVVKAVCCVHGGWVAADGAVGAGAVFTLYIPRQK